MVRDDSYDDEFWELCATCNTELDVYHPNQACAICHTKPKPAQHTYQNERCTCMPLWQAGKKIGIVVNPNCRKHKQGPR